MNKLMISTNFPATVAALLQRHELIETTPHWPNHTDTNLDIDYPDDGLGQALDFWLGTAKVCGLIEGYTFTHRLARHP